MGIELDKLAVEGNFLSRLAALENRIRALEARGVEVGAIDELGDNLGIMRSGAFIAGTGDPNSSTDPFTGVAMMSPGVDPAGTGDEWNLVGMNNGVVQAGISAADGKFYAGAGGVILDSEGVTLDLPAVGSSSLSTIKWTPDNGISYPVTIDAFSSEARTYLDMYANGVPSYPDGSISINAINEAGTKAAGMSFWAPQSGNSILSANADEIWLYTVPKISDAVAPSYFPLYAFDGWIDAQVTWTYLSANAFTIPMDYSSVYTKGTRLKFTNSTVKYAIVASSSYSAVTDKTTVTIVVNNNYTLAAGAISSPCISYFDSPRGWPGWFGYTAIYTGFSADPTTVGSQFKIIGNLIYINHYEVTAGTSNTTDFTVSLPVNASGISRAYFKPTYATNNSANIESSLGLILGGGSVANLYSTGGGGAWTASGTKRASFQAVYRWY